MAFVLLLLALVINFFTSAWWAFVTYKLYFWFIVSLGAPALSWWHVWGVTMVIGAIVSPYTYKDNDDDVDTSIKKIFSRMITLTLGAAILLLVGWIVKGQI